MTTLEWSHANTAAAADDALQEIKKEAAAHPGGPIPGKVGGGYYGGRPAGRGEGNSAACNVSDCPRLLPVVQTSQMMTLMETNWPPIHQGALRAC